MENKIKFNINWDVQVKLRDIGYETLLRYENRFRSPQVDLTTLSSIKSREDENGYIKFHMWELMSIFGGKIYHDADLPFETTIFLIPE
jgi:hypothetical protein